eukprot:comp17947_c0_seq1/m.18258 comp17947_c0_seq1/g.18258  ORF comp17947_c0_seq1/g.18258 comp17947_c0_seq1/m.18258 type:complete len:346 (-) comp17947_c0_seq1:180-1217(-)
MAIKALDVLQNSPSVLLFFSYLLVPVVVASFHLLPLLLRAISPRIRTQVPTERLHKGCLTIVKGFCYWSVLLAVIIGVTDVNLANFNPVTKHYPWTERDLYCITYGQGVFFSIYALELGLRRKPAVWLHHVVSFTVFLVIVLLRNDPIYPLEVATIYGTALGIQFPLYAIVAYYHLGPNARMKVSLLRIAPYYHFTVTTCLYGMCIGYLGWAWGGLTVRERAFTVPFCACLAAVDYYFTYTYYSIYVYAKKKLRKDIQGQLETGTQETVVSIGKPRVSSSQLNGSSISVLESTSKDNVKLPSSDSASVEGNVGKDVGTVENGLSNRSSEESQNGTGEVRVNPMTY